MMPDLSELFAEDEAKRIAAMNTPEALAAEAAMWERNRIRFAAETERARLYALEHPEPPHCDECGEEIEDCECEA